MKKHLVLIGFGMAIVATSLMIDGAPAATKLIDRGIAIAQKIAQPKVDLNLSVEQQQIEKDAQGKEKHLWKALAKDATVQNGDRLRYRVVSRNNGDRTAQNLIVTQPIPQGMVYQLRSATLPAKDVVLTYSIDNGKTFVAQPTIQVTLPNGKTETRPAPAEMYTHVRWNLGSALTPKAAIELAYEVKVR